MVPRQPTGPDSPCPDAAHPQKKKEVMKTGKILSVYEMPEAFVQRSVEIRKRVDGAVSIADKIVLLEEELQLLPDAVRWWYKRAVPDQAFPSIMYCRDKLPDYYMRCGKWEDAERVIRTCAGYNLYYPGDGSAELSGLMDYQDIAECVISFIGRHPGVYQKDMYSLLPDLDRGILKRVLRSSELIRKEPEGRTNKLYVREVSI